MQKTDLAVVVFAWGGSRPIYLPWHAENMRRMVAKHLTVPHRFIVVTDDEAAHRAEGLETLPLWRAPADTLERGPNWINCYVRLGLFDELIGGTIAKRILSIDLDAVIRAPIDDLVIGNEPFKAMSLKSRDWIQGGLFRVDPGRVFPNPWLALHEDAGIIDRCKGRGWIGSDQSILSELFYEEVKRGAIPSWNEDDGMAINEFYSPWRVFFRTGHKKCWQEGMEERAEYLAQSDRIEVPPDLPFSRGTGLATKTILPVRVPVWQK